MVPLISLSSVIYCQLILYFLILSGVLEQETRSTQVSCESIYFARIHVSSALSSVPGSPNGARYTLFTTESILETKFES